MKTYNSLNIPICLAPRQFFTSGDAYNYAEQLSFSTDRPVSACTVIPEHSVMVDGAGRVRVGVRR